MIPPHFQSQIDRQVQDAQDQAVLSASLPEAERPSGSFLMHGYEWTRHTPGDPMPCKRDAEIFILRRQDKDSYQQCAAPACSWWWGKDSGPTPADFEIIGWRYAAPPQEKDELAEYNSDTRYMMPMTELKEMQDESDRLRDENAAMRTALKEAHAALTACEHSDLCDHNVGFNSPPRPCDCGRDAALAKLQPFTTGSK